MIILPFSGGPGVCAFSVMRMSNPCPLSPGVRRQPPRIPFAEVRLAAANLRIGPYALDVRVEAAVGLASPPDLGLLYFTCSIMVSFMIVIVLY